jgi:hypothetical protein
MINLRMSTATKVKNTSPVFRALSTVIDKPKNVRIFIKYLDAIGMPDTEYLRAVYQVVGDIIALGGAKMKPVLTTVKQGKVGWDHVMFIPVEEKIREHDDYIVHPFDVVEGIAECGKCGSRRTYSSQKQTRGSDEPMTTFTRCAQCGEQWAYSG